MERSGLGSSVHRDRGNAVRSWLVFRGVDLDEGVFLSGGAPAVSVSAPQVNRRFCISGEADTGSKLVAFFEDRLQGLSNPLEIISTEFVRNHGVCLFEEIDSSKKAKSGRSQFVFSALRLAFGEACRPTCKENWRM